MTEKWDKESKEALIAYRINRTDETLREAELMYNEGHYNGAVNRLYYACYYISMALLLKKDIKAQTHSGVKTMISLHYISKGIIPKEIGKYLLLLFERRQSGDYDDFVLCDQEDVIDLREKAIAYINCAKSLLSETDEQ